MDHHADPAAARRGDAAAEPRGDGRPDRRPVDADGRLRPALGHAQAVAGVQRRVVGRVGVAIDSLADMETIFEGIPLDKVSTSFTINGTATILLAMYQAVAAKQGVAKERIAGTIQNDLLKEFGARGAWIAEHDRGGEQATQHK